MSEVQICVVYRAVHTRLGVVHVRASDHAQVLVAHVDKGLQIKVLGRGHFNVVNAPLRHLFFARIVEHARYRPGDVIEHLDQ